MNWPIQEVPLRTLSDAGRDKLVEAGARGAVMRWSNQPGFWTVERHNQCVEMWAAGRSAGVIAASLGTTRNAVLGRLHRHGLARSDKNDGVARKVRAALKRNRDRVRRTNRARVIAQDGRIPVVAGAVDFRDLLVLDGNAKRIPIGDLTSATCRWVCDGPGDDGKACYCGDHAPDGSWCAYHYDITHRPV